MNYPTKPLMINWEEAWEYTVTHKPNIKCPHRNAMKSVWEWDGVGKKTEKIDLANLSIKQHLYCHQCRINVKFSESTISQPLINLFTSELNTQLNIIKSKEIFSNPITQLEL